jgi:hypothetical protein
MHHDGFKFAVDPSAIILPNVSRSTPLIGIVLENLSNGYETNRTSCIIPSLNSPPNPTRMM